MAIFTIGHSTHSASDFTILASKLDTVIDVRSHPTSRWEQFRKEAMEKWLPEAGKGYEWWPNLGGWTARHKKFAGEMKAHLVDVEAYAKGKFPKQRIGKDFPNPHQIELPLGRPTWTNQGLWDYSWFMTLNEFLEGAEQLIERGKTERVGIMCCECAWWRCHRSMISDYLAFRRVDSLHLMPTQRKVNGEKRVVGFKAKHHSFTLGNRLERYHPDIIRTWRRITTS